MNVNESWPSAQLRDEVERLRAELAECQAHNDATCVSHEEARQLQEMAEQLAAEVERLCAAHTDERDEAERIYADLVAMRAERDEARAGVNRLATGFAAEWERAENAEAERDALRTQVEELRANAFDLAVHREENTP